MSLPRLVLLSAALHVLIGVRLLPAQPHLAAAILLVVVLLASAVLTPAGMLAHRIRASWADGMVWAGMLCLGLFSSLFVLTLLRDVLLAGAWLVDLVVPLPRAALSRNTGAAVPWIAFAVTALGFWNARRTARVVRVTVPVPRLPPALEGFRIVQITDIHVGPTIKADYLRAIVERVNALQPDVVAVTGDLVDGAVPDLAPHVAPLARLRARHGSYFVTGNHEYYSGVQPWEAELRRLGLRILHNEHVLLQHGQASLVLAGVTDFMAHHFHESHRSDPAAAVAGAPADAIKVLLAHQPRTAPAAVAAGVDLQISGHTHGGQFWPWNLFVPLQQPYTAGLHQLGRMWIYVSRGTGYWGPPKRFGAPSEIAELILAKSA
jgi:predicted MPP superfamily phosphohydrolase